MTGWRAHFHRRWLAVAASLAVSLLCVGPTLAADWRKDIGTFRIGMVAAAAPTPQGIEALKRAYSAALGMPVDIFLARDFAMLIDAQASARLEYAVYSATAYATAAELCSCVEPLAAPLDVDGAAGIHSVLIVRRGRATDLQDLAKLKTIVSSDDHVPGWQASLALLAEDGAEIEAQKDRLIRVSSATEALRLFAQTDADALFGWERASSEGAALAGGTLALLQAQGETTVEVLWKSPLIRFGPHTVRKSLDGEAKQILESFLTGLHGDNPQAYDLLSGGHGGGFMSVTVQDYDAARRIVRAAASSDLHE